MAIKFKAILPSLFLLQLSACDDTPKQASISVRMPDGAVIKNVPAGTSQTELIEKLQRNGYDAGRMMNSRGQAFYGYSCTGDCGGHQAGYDWAEENSIIDPDDCRGNSQSFVEGCRSFAEESGY